MNLRQPTRHLEIGIGTGRRLRQLVGQQGNREIVGIDKRRGTVKGRIKGARIILGKKGEAKTFLMNAARKGEKFDAINAEHVFDNLVPEIDASSSLFRGASFEQIIGEKKRRDIKRRREISEILGLIKQVLSEDGFLRLEVRKDSIRKNTARLKAQGFRTEVRMLEPEEVESRWGRIYFRQSEQGDRGRRPYEIIARLV